ncbi:MAG TPA: hypothetical protein PKD67_14315 [Ignavibacteriaceae bacterium]|nr:hypothetical protein [Ignavibacteriaceae bacterium]
MKKLIAFLPFIIIAITEILYPQSLTERYKSLGEMFVLQFPSAPFPHPKRINGHDYNGKTYSAKEHYSDSSVAIFIPKGLKPTGKINFVVYFHGWYNNIDSACAQFNLIEQFSESNKNAIFVFPEGPKNSPDSFGGKLEDKDGLKNLIDDVIKFLVSKNKIKSRDVGNIILAGHSGAYRVISFCLMQGGLTRNISDVILFDALYGQTEKYIHWIEKFNGRFINIYTDNGGTKEETEKLIKFLDVNKISFFQIEEKQLKIEDLTSNRLIFIHSDLTHNEVISKRNQFREFLNTSRLKNIK